MTSKVGKFFGPTRIDGAASILRFRQAGTSANSEKEQFGEADYWLPPDEFEKTKKGDCEDFALWAWRQILHMQYPARFVAGSAGRYGEGHAWVTFFKGGKWYLLEPLARAAGAVLPQLSIATYKPKFSMAWDGKDISYYAHKDLHFNVTPQRIPGLVFEWIIYWTLFWLRFGVRAAKSLTFKAFRKLSSDSTSETARN
jgi:hypothetical protein